MVDNFDDYVPQGDPWPFILGGRTWHVRPPEEFTIAEVAGLIGLNGPVRNDAFFRAILVPDEADAMVELLTDPTSTVRRGQVDAAIRGCYTQITGLPTRPPATSTPGRKPTGRKSVGGSSSPAARRKRSA